MQRDGGIDGLNLQDNRPCSAMQTNICTGKKKQPQARVVSKYLPPSHVSLGVWRCGGGSMEGGKER